MLGHKGVQRILEDPVVTAVMETRLEEQLLFSGGKRLSEAQAEDRFTGEDHKKLPNSLSRPVMA